MRYILFIFILGTIFTNVSAQNHLSFGSSGVDHPDTLYLGDPIEFNFWIVNNGSANLSDSITINCETFNNLGIQISGMQLGSFIDSTSTLNVGDSLYISIHDTVSYQSYMVGDNLIVIWPAFVTPVSSDTSMTYLHVLDTIQTTIRNEIKMTRFTIFPNPSSSDFHLESEPNSLISYFYVFDVLGNVKLMKENINKNKISVKRDDLDAGIYFIVVNINNEIIIQRLIVN